MDSEPQHQYFLAPTSRDHPDNWDLVKIVELWGVGTSRGPTARSVREGDALLIWQAKLGYAAECRVTGPARVPQTWEEVPWEGGFYQYGYVIPITVVVELRYPVFLPFKGQTQEVTGLSKSGLRSSLNRLTQEMGRTISTIIANQAERERSNSRQGL